MTTTTSEFDLYLGDKANIQGYRVRSISRDSAPQTAPRFSTGAEGQTELDLLKSASVDDFVGGMFQRDWNDSTKVARSVGIYNPYDAMLYPALAPTNFGTSLTLGTVLCKVENELYSFIAFGRYVLGSGAGTGYVSALYKVTKATGALTAITLPTVFTTNALENIVDLGLHKEYLYISTQYVSQINNYRMKISDNTFQDIGGVGVIMRALRGVLYHINSSSNIYSMSNETAAGVATYTLVDTTGQSDPVTAAPSDAIEFNGALWIAKPEGIYRFDGVKAVRVLKLRTRKFTEFNGALYFIAKQWLYKFDGTNVTKLQFFGYGEVFGDCSLSSNQDYLFLESFSAAGTFQSTTDKQAAGSALRRVYTWDGQAFNILYEWSLTGLYKPPSVGILYTEDTLFEIYGIAQSASDNAPVDLYYNRFDLQNYFKNTSVTPTALMDITTSEFDAKYPNVFKSANVIELQYKNMIAGDSLLVTYQLFDGKTWGSWITAGTITSTSDNKIELNDSDKMLFKRMKINVTATFAANSTFSMKGISLRWTLQPRVRWRWQALIAAHGLITDSRFNNKPTLQLTANKMNNLITQSIKQKTPVYMLSPDYGVVQAGVNASATTIVIAGDIPIYTDPYAEYPLIAIKNAVGTWEILRVLSATFNGTNTSIVVESRGYLGITAGAISTGAEFHLCYRVYVTRLMRDAPILDDNTYDEQTTKNSQLQREFMVEVIEV